MVWWIDGWRPSNKEVEGFCSTFFFITDNLGRIHISAIILNDSLTSAKNRIKNLFFCLEPPKFYIWVNLIIWDFSRKNIYLTINSQIGLQRQQKIITPVTIATRLHRQVLCIFSVFHQLNCHCLKVGVVSVNHPPNFLRGTGNPRVFCIYSGVSNWRTECNKHTGWSNFKFW